MSSAPPLTLSKMKPEMAVKELAKKKSNRNCFDCGRSVSRTMTDDGRREWMDGRLEGTARTGDRDARSEEARARSPLHSQATVRVALSRRTRLVD